MFLNCPFLKFKGNIPEKKTKATKVSLSKDDNPWPKYKKNNQMHPFHTQNSGGAIAVKAL